MISGIGDAVDPPFSVFSGSGVGVGDGTAPGKPTSPPLTSANGDRQIANREIAKTFRMFWTPSGK